MMFSVNWDTRLKLASYKSSIDQEELELKLMKI